MIAMLKSVGIVGNLSKKREVGEVWTDGDGKSWEQRSYGRVQQNELSETMSEVRNWMAERNTCKNKECSKKRYGTADKKLVRKTGFCVDCLSEKEFKIQEDGVWDTYQQYRIIQNMISYSNDVLSQLNQAYKDVKEEYEYVNEDGTTEKWKMEKSPDELKEDIMQDMQTISDEASKLREIRLDFWKKLDGKTYDLISEPTD
jgi:hypothetical protein